MTVDELIRALQGISAEGMGHAQVIVEEEGLGYTGDLLDVDTLLVSGDTATLCLLGRASETDIYGFMERVREHPDYVFGTIFTVSDFEDENGVPGAIPSHFDPREAGDRLAETGNEYIEFARALDSGNETDSP